MSDAKGPFTNEEFVKVFGGYTRTPTFFVDHLLVHKGIPASFWKFTAIAWRWWLAPGPPDHNGKFSYPYEFVTTQDQLRLNYCIHSGASAKWVAAYSVSGFVGVKYGVKHSVSLPGTPTVLHYRKTTTKDEWMAFIGALAIQCREDKKKHHGGSNVAYRFILAHRIYAERKRLGLPVEHFEKWFDDLKARKEVDVLPDGTCQVTRQRSDAMKTYFEKIDDDEHDPHWQY